MGVASSVLRLPGQLPLLTTLSVLPLIAHMELKVPALSRTKTGETRTGHPRDKNHSLNKSYGILRNGPLRLPKFLVLRAWIPAL